MTDQTRAPYPGLRAYEPSESDLFFGREDCVDEMLESLARTRFLAVLGNSGSGKSSLVRTGLLDALELGFLHTAGSDWKILDMHPGGRPLQNLAAAVLHAEGTPPDQIDLNLMRGQMSRGPRSLMQWCDEGNLGNDQSLLILVDQFEELFRYQDFAGREEAEAFVALLLESAKSHPRIHVVLTMRSEYLGACALMRGLAEQINAGLYLTPRMSRDECADAIVGPSKVLGFEVEPRLTNHILNDMASFAPWDSEEQGSSLVQLARRADQLPLMQHVLNRLWAAARESDIENPVLRFDDYEAVGGLSGAVNDHAEEVLGALSKAARAKTDIVFKALMSGTNISDAVRAPRPFGELVDLVGDEATTREIVDAYRAPGCNFLRPPLATHLDTYSIVDLGHESLIRQWDRLQDWLGEDTRANAQWIRIAAAQAAEADGAGDLLGGLDLDIAREWWSRAVPGEAWAKGRPGTFANVQDFLHRSIAESDKRELALADEARRKTRNLRMRAASYLLVAAVAVGAAVFSLNARSQAEDATQAAIDEREKAERSYALAVDATDTFVLDTAEQLSGAVGVPDEEVSRLLDGATAFVDQLEDQAGGSVALDALRSKVLTLQAEEWLVTGDLETATQTAEEAREILALASDTTDTLTPQQVEAFLNLMAFDYGKANFQRQYDLQMEIIDEALAFFEAHQHVLDEDSRELRRLQLLSGKAIALSALKDFEPSRALAFECLEALSNPQNAKEKRRKLNCAIILAYSYIDDAERPADVNDTIAEVLAQTDTEDFTLSLWDSWLFLQTDNLDRLSKAERYSEAVDLARMIQAQINRLVAAEPDNWDFRTRRNWVYYYQLVGLSRSGRHEEAYELAIQAHESLRDEPEVWGAGLSGAVSASVAYENISPTLGKPPVHVPKEAGIRLYIESLEAQAEVLAAQKRLTEGAFCDGCAVIPHLYLGFQFEELYSLGNTDRAADHFATHDRLVHMVSAILADPDQTPVSKAHARRTMYWMVDSLPHVANIVRVEDVDTKIMLLEQSVARRTAYMNAHPYASMLRLDLSDIHAELAELYFDKGQVDEALAHAEDGAGLEGLRALRLKREWLATGAGPFARDKNAARDVLAQITSRDWTVAKETIRARRGWSTTTGVETFSLSIFDAPLGSDEQPMLNAIKEVRLHGFEISDAEEARFLEIQEAARAAGLTTVRHIMERGKLAEFDIGNPDQIAAELVRYTQDEDPSGGSALLLTIWQQVDNGEKVVADALKTYLQNEAEAGYFRRLGFVEQVGLSAAYDGHFQIGAAVFSRLLERGHMLDLESHARVLTYRGHMFDRLGMDAEQDADYLAALTMFPDDPQFLNSLGYSWSQKDTMLPAALQVLERAVALTPNESDSLHYYLDSLGWAYVRDGQLERGLEKLLEAVGRDAEPQAEILFHVGETYRRLGDHAEALNFFGQALEIVQRPEIRSQIETQMKLAAAQIE